MKVSDVDPTNHHAIVEIATRTYVSNGFLSSRQCREYLLSDACVAMYVIEHKAQMVACAILGKSEDTHDVIMLSHVYVDPQYRRMGIGTYLVGVVCNRAHSLGFGCVYVRAPDAKTARFFEMTGVFTPTPNNPMELKGYCGSIPTGKKMKSI